LSNNTTLPPPPQNVNFFTQFNTINVAWSSWFNDIYQTLGIQSYQKITGAQPVNINSPYVDLNVGTNSYAISLDPPTVNGLAMTISMSNSGGGHVTLPLTNIIATGASTSCTWNNPSDTIYLISIPVTSIASKWWLMNHLGVVLV
jgi:hypothetical protein